MSILSQIGREDSLLERTHLSIKYSGNVRFGFIRSPQSPYVLLNLNN